VELNIITWLWGDKYKPHDVYRLATQVHKHLKLPHTFTAFSDREHKQLPNARLIKDRDLCDRACFCRLRMFDPDWQRENGFIDWIVSLDLDLVITGSLDGVFLPRADFMILKGVNAVNPNPFNASVMMLRAGTNSEVWSEFSRDAASKIEQHEFPDDQGWIWHMLPDASGWQAGKEGIYGFQKPGWPNEKVGFALPDDARIVSFIGKRKPQMYTQLAWVKKHWVEATRQ